MKKHVEAEKDLPIYAPSSVRQAFMAIEMSLPMFRMIKRTQDADRQRTQEALSTMQSELTSLGRRVDDLAKSVAQAAQEAAAAAAESAKLRAAVAELEAERFQLLDPVLLAIDPAVGIGGAGFAFIGPAWGPDFDEIVAKALLLKAVSGQRAQIEKVQAEWTTFR